MENFKNKFYDYLLLEKNYSQHTVIAYINDIGFFESFLSNEFEDDNLLRVNYNQIRSWIVSLSDDGISNASINRKISSLKSFYKFLLKTKQIDTSPLLKHKAGNNSVIVEFTVVCCPPERYVAIQYSYQFIGVFMLSQLPYYVKRKMNLVCSFLSLDTLNFLYETPIPVQ